MTDWDRANFFYTRAETNFHNKEYEKAIDLYSQAIEILYRLMDTRFFSKCLYSRGLCYYELGQSKNAIDDLTISLNNKPSNAQGWLFLGSSHLRLGNLEKGIECLIYSVELEPKNLFAWNMKAFANISKSDLNSAKNDINHVLRNDPENEWAKNNLKWIDESEKYFREEANFFQNNINNKNITVNIHNGLNILNIFTEHEDIVTNIILSEDGKTAISVDINNLLVWKTENRKIIYKYQNDSFIQDVKFVSNGQFVLIDVNHQLKIVDYINNEESTTNVNAHYGKRDAVNLDISPDKTIVCLSMYWPYSGELFLIDLSTKFITTINLFDKINGEGKDAFFVDYGKSIFFLNELYYPGIGIQLHKYNFINRDIVKYWSCEQRFDRLTYSNDREIILCWKGEKKASFDYYGDPIFNGTGFDILLYDIPKREPLISWSIENLPPSYEDSGNFCLSNNGDIIVFKYGPFNYQKHKNLNIHGKIIFAVWKSQNNIIDLFHFPKGIQKIALSNDGEFALISSEKEIYICELETYITKTQKI